MNLSLNTGHTYKESLGKLLSRPSFFEGIIERVLSMLFVTVLWSDVSVAYFHNSIIKAVSAGGDSTCAITSAGGGRVLCWGEIEFNRGGGSTYISNPTAVVTASAWACALTDQGVRCWGRVPETNSHGLNILLHPRAIAVGGLHGCALADTGVHCWGSNQYNQIDVPANLQNPRAISVGDTHSCASTDEGIRCWGLSPEVPENLRNPRELSSSEFHNCALMDDGVQCWEGPGILYTPSDLHNPNSVSAGILCNCALTDDGIRCWRTLHGSDQWCSRVPTDMRNVTAISSGGKHVCALGDNIIRCWGDDHYGQSKVPAGIYEDPTFTADLRELANRNYANKSRFLRAVTSLNEGFGATDQFLPAKPALFVFFALEQFLRFHSATHYQTKVLSDWKAYQRRVQAEGREGSLKDFPRIDQLLKISLKLIDAGLTAIKPDLRLSAREEIYALQEILANLLARTDIDSAATLEFRQRWKNSEQLQLALLNAGFESFHELFVQQLAWIESE